ncbi:phytoene desaturase [Mangrovibacillus cuniculi]|uniref:4,4'-diaponeurosporene oxygenase n=2 Tax=Mangrovibacillus cuniculi TaxID=2593652 RepID=A0A7S8HH22_9BACI|nr:phytoene desaturase [Mangrovibacillus cuniculi]
MRKVLIIGAGLGGLAAGIKLQASGFEVTIIEANEHAGGKMMPVNLNGYSFDFGPNTITMPKVFEKVLSYSNKEEMALPFVKLTDHTKNVFSDGSEFIQTTDREKMINQLSLLDPHAASNYVDYLTEVERLYTLGEKSFFYRTFTSWRDYLDPSLSKALLQVRPLEDLDSFHKKYFMHENVRNVFNRYATYIGSSPYKAPATFGLIGHLEMNEGVFYVEGGNTLIAQRFSEVFTSLGGKLRLNTKVKEIDIYKGKAYGVKTSTDERISGEIVIINGDYVTATKNLIKESNRPRTSDKELTSYEPSVSAFVIMVGLKTYQPTIHHHHVFYPKNYRQEFEDIFTHKKLPTDPTIYISHSAATDPNRTKGSNLFILVNAPAVEKLEQKELTNYKEKIYDRLEAQGIPIRAEMEIEKVITPIDIGKKFFANKGALYGISAHAKKDAFLRPINRSKDIKNVYYVGGTTHPGGGSPMVTISGLNVAEAIIHQYKR